MIFRFFIFSSLYIALCAVLMVWQTDVLLGLQYGYASTYPHIRASAHSYIYFAFVCCSTICSYNFHWYLTPAEYSTSERIQWGARHKALQLGLCAAGGLGAVYYGWLLRAHWLPLSGAAVLTFLYSAPKLPQRAFVWLRKIAVGKTLFLTFVWMYVTTLLPVLISDELVNWSTVSFALHRFFLIYAICILFDFRDVEADKQQGIRSLITFLPEKQLFRVYYLSLVLSALGALLLWPVVTPAVIATLLAPVAVTWLLTEKARRNRSDYMYYFVLDGLMMLSALLHLVLYLLADS
ncbi:UbiA prenyltransferase family protein [Chitinophaga japonensis]|uniref:UbiA prenyltransferase family protein n=1 Tax=Chitinophaga japonensis TaxID=104662 RepID=A0A562T580_CHIJA|nr:UbiA family prenyltransferase [Chitinophaga japonensis]TWI88701.1 UbiA prenyltransferase family protein [Chitinophaga japonensis]